MTSYANTQYDDQGRARGFGEFDVVWDPATRTNRVLTEGDLRPMRNLQGHGFIVVSTDGQLISEELATYDDALDKAAEFLDAPKPGVVIYEALGLIRPRRDVVARMTKRGAELEAQRTTKSLPIPRDYEGEAQDEVDEIAPASDEPKPAERTGHEVAGTAYDAGAAAHELVGRDKKPRREL
jgi:hypothetical protein